MSRTLLVLALSLACNSAFATSTNDIEVFGMGALRCRDLSAENRPLATQRVSGFVTGWASQRHQALPETFSTTSLQQWIEHYCDAHGNDSMMGAGAQYFKGIAGEP
jgi:hypothetical protein